MLPQSLPECGESVAKAADSRPRYGQMAAPGDADSNYPPFGFYPIIFQIDFLVLTIL